MRTIIGANIAAARAAADMTQMELARAVDAQPTDISRWERGKVQPRLETLTRLAETLSRDLAWFFTEHKPDGDETTVAA